MTIQEFPHQHTAHCESGVMSTLLKYHGHNLDEAMIFGISHALTFVWMPLIKLNGMPLVSYRTAQHYQKYLQSIGAEIIRAQIFRRTKRTSRVGCRAILRQIGRFANLRLLAALLPATNAFPFQRTQSLGVRQRRKRLPDQRPRI